jgi:predicted MFS family arabinose efflux permease
MVMGAVGGLALGKLFDAYGLRMLVIGFLLSAFSAPLLFLGGAQLALAGMILWGIGLGTQGSLLNAIVAELVPSNKRSTAFGVFDAAFGVAWFAGSWLMGILYERSIIVVVLVSAGLQLLSLPIFFVARRREGTQ